MVVYVKGADIDLFFMSAHQELIEKGFVHLRLEPGDCTRYELVITELERDYLVSLINVGHQTCLIGKEVILIEPALLGWRYEINEHTNALVAEVFNGIKAARPLGMFFDWAVGRAKLKE